MLGIQLLGDAGTSTERPGGQVPALVLVFPASAIENRCNADPTKPALPGCSLQCEAKHW